MEAPLKRKIESRYRQVLAELKDYEIYKNVMESALTKMQKEMEELLSENQSLKAKLSNEKMMLSDERRTENSTLRISRTQESCCVTRPTK